MRIAFFHNLPPGGGKRSAHEWIKRMTKQHQVDLYLYDSSAEDFLDLRPYVNDTFLVPGGNLKMGTRFDKLGSYYRIARVSEEVARRINIGKYDLAFIMQCKVYNTPFVLRHLRIPSLYFCHEPLIRSLEPHASVNRGRLVPLRRLLTGWLTQLDRANALHSTLICTSSLYSRENIYRAYGVYPRLNYLGIDSEQFRPLSLKRQQVILSVGSLFPIKKP